MKIELLGEPEIAALTADLRKARGSVTLATAWHPYPKISQQTGLAILKDFVQHLFGLKIAFEKLPLLTTEEATRTAMSFLETDMAYGGEPLMSSEESKKYVDRFFSGFRNAWFFTNRYNDNSWYSFSRSTFDAAILVVDPKKAGLMVVEDED